MNVKSPLVQMTLALVTLTTALVMLADMFLNLMPDRTADQMAVRRSIATALAAQVAASLSNDDPRPLEQALRSAVHGQDDVRSLAVRRQNGSIVVEAGDHKKHWAALSGDRSTVDQMVVPLNTSGARWGRVEVAFRADERSLLRRWLDEPMVRLMMFISVLGSLMYGLYLRRALQHLDPAAVIPERVQRAFDAMAEGVVVLDAQARVMLVNSAFLSLHEDARKLGIGQALSQTAWLAAGLGELATHPWHEAMAQRGNVTGRTVMIGDDDRHARQLVLSCAPITDTGGGVRGCLVTFNDVTDLHHANRALREAMQALSASRDEVQRKNEELQLLATRDPLTGCLNRRAFFDAARPLFSEAKQHRSAMGCLILDIDHFKKVNDTHGHALGDRVIQEVAKKLQQSARSTDLVCRYGGEEFCIVVAGLEVDDMLRLAERVRQKIEDECGPAVREVEGMRVTVSLGLQMVNPELAELKDLIDEADQALYQAKRNGRNRVVLAEETTRSA